MESPILGNIIVAAFFLIALGVNCYNWWKNRKEYWKVDKVVTAMTIFALSEFIFLMLTSFLVQINNPGYFQSNLWFVQLVDTFTSSIHFAVNAMTAGLLMDKTGVTKTILESFIINGDFHTPAYFEICFMLLLAPVSTAGWLVSIIDSDLGAKLSIIFFRSRSAIVFYNCSERSTLTAGFVNEYIRQKTGKTVLVFCRYDSEQNHTSLEARSEIRRLKGILVKFTERDYVYHKGKKNTLFLCVNSLSEMTEYMPPQYSFPENISRVFLMSNEAKSEIELAKSVVCGKQGEGLSENELPDVEPLSIWEAIAERVYEIIEKLDNGLIVGEGNILPVVLHKIRRIFEDSDAKQQSGRNEDKVNHITAFPLQDTIYHQLVMEYGSRESVYRNGDMTGALIIGINDDAYKRNNPAYEVITEHIESYYPDTSKWLLLASEDEEANLRRKRLLCKRYKVRLNQDSMKIIVYCSDRMATEIEKKWDGNNEIENIYYVGEDQESIKWLYEHKIKGLL